MTEIPLFTCQLAKIKKLDNTSIGKAVRKQAFMYIAAGNANRYNTFEGEFGNIYHNYLCVYILTQDPTCKN